MTRRALLMASGANRGAYYAGFLDPLSRAGVTFDVLAGVSAGGIAAAWFAAGDAEALIRSWQEADRWRVAFHPWLETARRRTVDHLLRTITLRIMDLESARTGGSEVRMATSRIIGPGLPLPKLERCVFSNKGIGTDEEFAVVLRATAFVPWINGCRTAVKIAGERYLDGGLTGRIPLAMIEPGEVDELWLAACSPNGMRELQEELETAEERPERIIVLTPSEPLPVTRWTMEWERIRRAIEIGRRDMERALAEGRSVGPVTQPA